MTTQDSTPTLDLNVLKELKAKLAAEKIPIAFVLPLRLEPKVREMFKDAPPADTFTDLATLMPPRMYGKEVYFDPHQEVECFAFYDREALSRYLNRMKDPEGWAKYLENQYAPIERR